MAPSTNQVNFTSLINRSGITPVLTRRQIWAGLLLKIRSAETFVPAALQSTLVLKESLDPLSGNSITVRDIVFRADQRKVRETVTAYEDCRLDFLQSDGSTISNTISEGADGELYMTYTFDWRHPGVAEDELAALKEEETKIGKMAVEGTITAMRELVRDGKI